MLPTSTVGAAMKRSTMALRCSSVAARQAMRPVLASMTALYLTPTTALKPSAPMMQIEADRLMSN